MNERHHPNKETTLKLQLHEMGLFRTPDSMNEVIRYIENLPDADARSTAWTVFAMLNNLMVDRLRTGDLVLFGDDPTPPRSVQKRDEFGREFV
jgi:hypothetical protein